MTWKAKIEDKLGLSKLKNTDKPQETAKLNSSQGCDAPSAEEACWNRKVENEFV